MNLSLMSCVLGLRAMGSTNTTTPNNNATYVRQSGRIGQPTHMLNWIHDAILRL